MRVIKILEWVCSEKLDKYIKQLKHVNLTQLVFELIEKDSQEFISGRLGYSEYVPSEKIHRIGVRSSIPNQAVETIVCHEIEHIELIYAGFNMFLEPSRENRQNLYWNDFCTSMISTFSDVIIDKKLKKMGFDFQYINSFLFESLVMVKYIHGAPKPLQFTNCLRATGESYILSGKKEREFKKIYLQKAMPIYLKSIEIKKIADKIGFNTPEKYNTLIERLVDYLEVGDDVIVFKQEFK